MALLSRIKTGRLAAKFTGGSTARITLSRTSRSNVNSIPSNLLDCCLSLRESSDRSRIGRESIPAMQIMVVFISIVCCNAQAAQRRSSLSVFQGSVNPFRHRLRDLIHSQTRTATQRHRDQIIHIATQQRSSRILDARSQGLSRKLPKGTQPVSLRPIKTTISAFKPCLGVGRIKTSPSLAENIRRSITSASTPSSRMSKDPAAPLVLDRTVEHP